MLRSTEVNTFTMTKPLNRTWYFKFSQLHPRALLENVINGPYRRDPDQVGEAVVLVLFEIPNKYKRDTLGIECKGVLSNLV